MSNFAWIIVIVLILTALGSLTLFFITIKYYWGVRGAPPPTGEARRSQKEEELRLRAKQIELSEKNPRETRSSSFWDNRKRAKR
ncbi:MAG TPA: hypothetical protein VGC76_13430 [Pyrinomonadaceae bacterium]|jgi:hypothetical protein